MIHQTLSMKPTRWFARSWTRAVAAVLVGLLVGSAAAPGAAPPAMEVRHEEIAVEAPFPMPPIRVPVFPARDFPITAFGARAGGEFNNRVAIQKAVDACHQAGGGRVVIPAGEWLTGALSLKSRVILHLAEGAVLRFSDRTEDCLPAVQTSWEGWECFNYSPLIHAFDCENTGISGSGTLEARMDRWRPWMKRPPAHLAALKQLYTMGSTGVPVDQRRMATGEHHLRPQFIQFNRCRNVRIEGVRIRNSPFWTIHLLLCDSVLVRGVDIHAHGHNNDGIDPEGTRNLLVEDCRFDQGDDAIAIKSGTNHDGWRLNTPSENIVIRRCTVLAGHQLVAIGSELSGGVRNVFIHDCRFAGKARPDHLLFIKTNRRRGGFVENIVMEDIEAGGAKFGVLGIETDVLYQWRTLVPAYEERITRIRGITVRRIKVGETATPFRILGDAREPVRDITLADIAIGTVRGRKHHLENATGIREGNITIGTFVERPDPVNRNR